MNLKSVCVVPALLPQVFEFIGHGSKRAKNAPSAGSQESMERTPDDRHVKGMSGEAQEARLHAFKVSKHCTHVHSHLVLCCLVFVIFGEAFRARSHDAGEMQNNTLQGPHEVCFVETDVDRHGLTSSPAPWLSPCSCRYVTPQ